MQRILLYLLLFFNLHANTFHGFVSLAIIDTLTGNVQKILLEANKDLLDNQFKIRVNNIETDEENLGIAWVDLVIHYQASKNDIHTCVQKGKLNTTQTYRIPGGRYLIGFDILPYIEDKAS